MKNLRHSISAKPDDLYPICYSILKCILVLRFLFCSHCLKIIEKKRAAMKNQSCCIPSNSDPCTAVVYMVDAKLPINAHANFSNAWVRGISNLSNIALQGTIQSYYDCFLSTKFKIYSLLGSFHSQASHCCWISAILRPCFTSTYIAQWVGHSDRGPNSYFGIRKRRNFKIWEKLFPNYKKQHNIMWSRFVC